jgi:hypothetical protein
MGHRVVAAVSATVILFVCSVATSFAQGQQPRSGQLPPHGGQMGSPQRSQEIPPPRQQQPQQPQQPQQQQQQQQSAPAKPYKPVAIGVPEPMKDQSFEAFRKQLAAVAQRKDRRALAGLVVANGFFWLGESGDKAEAGRPGIDNLAKIIGLDAKDGPGWGAIESYAAEPTAMPYPDRKDTYCAPADPNFNGDEFDALIKATGTDEGEWGYPMQPGIEVRAAPQSNAAVIDKLGMHFVRVLEETSQGNQGSPMLRVVTPSGKTGFVSIDAISPLGGDQLCYVKSPGGWKITGFVGGEQ